MEILIAYFPLIATSFIGGVAAGYIFRGHLQAMIDAKLD